MKRIIALLKVDKHVDVPTLDHDCDTKAVGELLEMLRINIVDYLGYNKDEHGLEIDNHEDYHDEDSGNFEPLLVDETFYNIRLAVEPENEDKLFFDDTPGYYNALKYITDKLTFKGGCVTHCYEREHNGFTKTVVEITVT